MEDVFEEESLLFEPWIEFCTEVVSEFPKALYA